MLDKMLFVFCLDHDNLIASIEKVPFNWTWTTGIAQLNTVTRG
jgi:hypothetical protein